MLCDCRQYEELRDALGLFAKYLPVRCQLTEDLTLGDVLRETERGLNDAREWQDYWEPRLEAGKDAIAFDYVEQPAPYCANGVTFSLARQYCCIDRYKLKLAVTKAEGQILDTALCYDPQALDRDTVSRIADSFTALLHSAIRDPDCAIGKLSILSARERQRLLTDLNQTRTDQADHKCVHHWFEARVKQTPNDIALVCGEQRLTYTELNARANRLAHVLRRNGVAPDTCVPLWVERSAEALVGVLGILKAGGAYVPLNPEYPTARLAHQLSEIGAPVLVTQQSLLDALPDFAGEVLCLDDGQTAGESEDDPSPAATLEHLVYVLYTSGSTGTPKGVAVTHASLSNYTEFIYGKLGLEHKRLAFATVSTLSADLGNTCIFPSLVSGGCLHVLTYEVATDAKGFAEYVAKHPIDVLKIVPSHLKRLLDSDAAILPREYLILAGEASPWKLIERIAERGGSCRVINHYGPTETTVGSLTFDLNDERSASATVPIGRPITNTEVYVLDPHRNPVPIGVAGELHIGGAGLARGYLNRLELTAEKFISNPFSEDLNSGLYKTGDLVRYLPDGNIEFLGRIDQQVKIRGFRIEFGEIEAAIARHAAIREAVVLAREDVPGDKRLVAYMIADNPPADLVSEVRALLCASLPEYMVPAAFVVLDVLPLTPNGKVDRNALPVPDASAELKNGYVAPRTATEEILANIWTEVLGLERVGVEDNFFELGGHSLLAMSVVSRVRKALSVELPLRELFAARTIAALAAQIEPLRTEARSVLTFPAVKTTAEAGPAELSFSQQRLWLLDQIEPGGAAYIIARALELSGALDGSALEHALAALVHRHEALRTVFVKLEERPLQVVSEQGAWTLPVADLSGEVDAREQLTTLLREEASRAFDLARGPLFRARLYRLAPDTHVLLLAMHHIISDGWSLGILNRELGELYDRFCRREAAALPVLSLQYRDFARWQRTWLEGETLEGLLSHWRSRLAGAPQVLQLPTDRPRPLLESHRGASYSFRLPLELAQSLRGLAQREGATLFMTLLSGFTLLLSRYSGQQDLLVGTPVANRNRAEIEDMVGFFVNTLLLRADLSGDPSASQYLARMREVCLDAYAHQDLPFERLVEEMRPQRDLSRNPLFQVMFALQNAPLRALELPGLTLRPVDVKRGTAKFDLTLQMQETAEGLNGSFEYATDLFEEPTIARMATHLRWLLEGMSATPERSVWDLPLLDRRLSGSNCWSSGTRHKPTTRTTHCIHELFEAQVKRTPERTAVRVGATALSYAELDGARHPHGKGTAFAPRGPRRAGRACASSGAPTWSPRCWASSRPVPPTCRSILRSQRNGCASWPRTHNLRCWCPPRIWRVVSLCRARANCCSTPTQR